MTQHSHNEIVPGCFRCDIGLDELLFADDPTPPNRLLEAVMSDDWPVPEWDTLAEGMAISMSEHKERLPKAPA